MRYFLENAQVIAPYSDKHLQNFHILIENGLIRHFLNPNQDLEVPQDAITISSPNLKVSAGWLDMRCLIPDPGQEFKESLASGTKAAMKGGFTEIALLPSTHPPILNAVDLSYFERFNQNSLVRLLPMAKTSTDGLGNDMTEMIDLHHSGAIAFTEGENAIQNTDAVRKILVYLQKFNGLLIQRPDDSSLSKLGQMNEGVISTQLGLPGIPHLAEELMIQRDLNVLEYYGGKLHLSLLSSARSVDLIREAKQKGLAVTCDIAAHQLAFDDSVMLKLESVYKVNPPFRMQEDIVALKKGLADGTIDAIVSDHNPQDTESKELELDLSAFGVIGLETTFAVANTFSDLPLENLVEKLTTQPRKILKVSQPEFKEGELANLTVFDAELDWTYQKEAIVSKSKNSPFINHQLKGRVLAVFNQGKAEIV